LEQILKISGESEREDAETVQHRDLHIRSGVPFVSPREWSLVARSDRRAPGSDLWIRRSANLQRIGNEGRIRNEYEYEHGQHNQSS
jgi:hypothetical protein